MSNGLPKNWEPGQNHGWKQGHSKRSRRMAWFGAVGMLLLAAVSFLTVCAAVLSSGCATFVNRGDAFSELKHRPVLQAQEVTP